jgi:hypothetical protein
VVDNHISDNRSLESIRRTKSDYISVKISWQRWSNRQSFTIAVKIVIRLQPPLRLHINDQFRVRSLKIRLQRSANLTNVHNFCASGYGTYTISSFTVEMTYRRENKTGGAGLRWRVIVTAAEQRSSRSGANWRSYSRCRRSRGGGVTQDRAGESAVIGVTQICGPLFTRSD